MGMAKYNLRAGNMCYLVLSAENRYKRGILFNVLDDLTVSAAIDEGKLY